VLLILVYSSMFFSPQNLSIACLNLFLNQFYFVSKAPQTQAAAPLPSVSFWFNMIES